MLTADELYDWARQFQTKQKRNMLSSIKEYHDHESEIGEPEALLEKSQGDQNAQERFRPLKRLTSLQIYGIFLLTASVGLVLLWYILNVLFHSHTLTPEKQASRMMISCGNTSETAIASGCEFDLLSYKWLPRECQDYKTRDEFREWVYHPDRQYGAFPFFEDVKGEIWIPDEEKLSRRTNVVTHSTRELHKAHCSFTLRRMARAHTTGQVKLRTDMGLPHMLHCTDELVWALGALPEDIDELHSGFTIGFGTCS